MPEIWPNNILILRSFLSTLPSPSSIPPPMNQKTNKPPLIPPTNLLHRPSSAKLWNARVAILNSSIDPS